MRKTLTLLFVCMLMGVFAKAQYVNIPDSNFRALLIQIHPTCFDSLGRMDTTCNGIVNEDSLYCISNSIQDLTGVQYFKSLTLLDCDSNLLASIPSLPSTLQYLFCSNNQLTSLPTLPNHLITLSCEYNQLASLPTLPALLTSILCDENKIQNLPSLPDSLKVLVCAFNQLKGLPTLPTNLNSLDCGSNQLTTMPTLPDSLQYFFCYGNQLASLPALPNNLNLLDCDENSIAGLPSLPDSLNTLYCNNNNLTSVQQHLPISLNYLNVGYNNISSLPPMDSLYQLQYLYCQGDSSLSCLPKLPNSLDSLNVSGTGVGCIPNNAGNDNIYPSGLPICDITNNINKCSAFPTIKGKVFYDNNSNGIKDSDEFYIPYIPVSLSTGEISYTNALGQYTFTTSDTGFFTLTTILPSYYKAVPNSTHFGFTSFEEQVTLQDIAIQPNGLKDSLSISIIPWQNAVPGREVAYTIAYRNLGTVISNDTISVTYDTSKLIFDSSSVLLLSNMGNTLVWLDTLRGSYYSNKYFRCGYQDPLFVFKVNPSAIVGTTVQCSANIASTTTSASTINNIVVKDGYDPNNKQATPQLTTTQVANGDGIDYTILFQNVGTDTVINIVITDSLSGLLNPLIFQTVASSPSPTTWTLNNNVLQFQYLNINLVDSGTNQLMSNGFIHFNIPPTNTVTAGNIIYNNASIYFDYNKPVVTNTATTLITDSALPVSIINYQLKQIDGRNIQIENYWTTANEQNTSYYNIQKSINGINFTTIGKVFAKGSGSNSYQYIDNYPASGINYYRLQSVDKNGAYSFSKVVSITTYDSQLTTISIFPNPAKSFIIVKGKNIKEVNIIDDVGRVVETKKGLNVLNNQNKVEFKLSEGVYVAQILLADGKIVNKKFVIE